MRRFLASFRSDVLRQIRYGLYAVSVFMVLVWGVGLRWVAIGTRGIESAAVPAFVAFNLIVTTFYFTAALVLMEKTEDTLSAMMITPLRYSEYLLSKGLSLSFLAIVESVLVIVLIFGPDFDWLMLLPASTCLGLLYTWWGFLVVLRYASINAFLMPSAVYVAALTLPILSHFGITGRWAFAWHPVEPAMTTMRAAYLPTSGWELAYGLVGMIGWTGLTFVLARRRLARFALDAAWR